MRPWQRQYRSRSGDSDRRRQASVAGRAWSSLPIEVDGGPLSAATTSPCSRRVTDDGEEVTLTGPLAHVHEGEALERRRRVAHASPSTAASSTSSACARAGRSPRTRCSATWQPSSTSARAAPRGCSSATAASVLEAIDRDPRGRARRRRRASAGAGCRAAVRSWERQGGDARGAAVPRRARRARGRGVAARAARFGAGRDRAAARPTPTRATEVDGHRLRDGRRAGAALGVPADAPGAARRRARARAARWPRTTATATSPAPSSSSAPRRLLGADASATGSTSWRRRGRLVVDDERVADPAVDAIERRLARARARAGSTPSRLLEVARAERPDGDSADDQWAAVAPGARRTACRSSPAGPASARPRRCARSSTCCAPPSASACGCARRPARRRGAWPRATGAEATTIHRLLEWSPEEGGSAATRPTRSPAATC